MQHSDRAAAVEIFQMELGRQVTISGDGHVTEDGLKLDLGIARAAIADALARTDNPAALMEELAGYAAWLYYWSLRKFEADPIAESLELGSTYIKEN